MIVLMSFSPQSFLKTDHIQYSGNMGEKPGILDIIPEERQVVVVDSVRTPTGKSGWNGMEKEGQFAYIPAHDLLGSAIEELLDKVRKEQAYFDPKEIEDLAVGCLSQIGEQAQNIGRIQIFASDLPQEVAGWTLNRYCTAGLQAINSQAQGLMTEVGDISMAAGVEHMSHYGMGSDYEAAEEAEMPIMSSERTKRTEKMRIPQGVSAEKIAEEYGHDKVDLDNFGLWSQQKAVKELDNEKEYKKRVVPVTSTQDGKTKKWEKDEPPRRKALENPEEELEAMKNLPTPFKDDGVVTAGNSSGIVDGAAATLLATKEKAEELGLEPKARIVSMAVAAGDPELMLLAPVPAIEKIFDRTGYSFDDVDVWEPNEAFVSPVLAYCDEFGIDYDDPRINPTGGATSIGHPIGASGVIYFTEMVHYLERENLDLGLQSICGGGGLGVATLIERI